MRLKLSYIYAPLFVVCVCVIGIGTIIYDSLFNPILIYSLLAALGLTTIANAVFVEKKFEFLDHISEVKTQPAQEVIDELAQEQTEKIEKLKDYITDHLNKGHSLDKVMEALTNAGHNPDDLNFAVGILEKEGVVRFKEPELPSLEEPEDKKEKKKKGRRGGKDSKTDNKSRKADQPDK